MSGKAVGWVFEHSPLSGTALVVHLAIADVVNDCYDNEFWMRMAQLAVKARCNRDTVRAALRQMTEFGLIELVEDGGGRGKPNRYRMLFPETKPAANPRVCEPQRVEPADETRGCAGGFAAETRGFAPPPYRTQRDLTQENPTHASPSAPKQRQRDPIFDAIAEVTGLASSSSARAVGSRIGKCKREIEDVCRAAGLATDPERLAAGIRTRATRYRERYPKCDLTPEALAKHFATLGPQAAAPTTTTWQPPTQEQLVASALAKPEDEWSFAEQGAMMLYRDMQRDEAERQGRPVLSVVASA